MAKLNKRKRQIIHAARELFIKKGFANTSIMDIIAAANISKGTFYNHFSSKNECLIAILEEAKKKLQNARLELAYGKDPSDILLLKDQLSLFFHFTRKQSFAEMFSPSFDSNDGEIKEVIEKHMIMELEWLENRLIDVYGENIRPIAFECAVHSFAIMGCSLHFLSSITQTTVTAEAVVETALDCTDAIIHRMMEAPNILFTDEIVQKLKSKVCPIQITKEYIIKQLDGFVQQLTNKDSVKCWELATYLLQELKKPDEKIYVLESIIVSFNNAFRNTPHQAEAIEISNNLWNYLNSTKEHQ